MGINSHNRVDHYPGSTHANQQQHLTTTIMTHDVCLPPQKTTLQKLQHRLSEVFFPDDPLHGFKNQSGVKKFILALQFFFPIFEWAPKYSLMLFRSDVVSGLTIASLAIPQGISYAKLANLPPIIGLYSSFVPPLIYSVLGSSKHLAVGPVSIASLVMGTMLNDVVPYNKDPDLYLKLAFTATFFAGVFQATLGLLRLGFVIDFLSKATLLGFMGGAAVIVSLQQLKGLLGITHFTNKMQIYPVLSSAIQHRNEWSWQTYVMGFCFLAFLLTTRHIERKANFSDRIAALQKLVSPYGKTDTASVLHEAMEYINFLHDQVKVLSAPYLQSKPAALSQELESHDLKSKGLRLVPVSHTIGVASSNGADIWAPIKTTSPKS